MFLFLLDGDGWVLYTSMFNCLRNYHTVFPKWLNPITFIIHEGSYFPVSWAKFIIVSLPNHCNFGGRDESHLSVIWHFPSDKWCWEIFHVLLSHSYLFLSEIFTHMCWLSFDGLSAYYWALRILCMLWIYCIHVCKQCTLVYHSAFNFFNDNFWCAKVLSFNKVQFIVLFYSSLLLSKKYLPDLMTYLIFIPLCMRTNLFSSILATYFLIIRIHRILLLIVLIFLCQFLNF